VSTAHGTTDALLAALLQEGCSFPQYLIPADLIIMSHSLFDLSHRKIMRWFYEKLRAGLLKGLSVYEQLVCADLTHVSVFQ